MARYNNDGVAHAWAWGYDDEATNAGGTLYCASDNIIYSYGSHYPMARRYHELDVVLFNAEGSTKTTEKQKSIVRRAIPPRYTVIDVSNISPRNADEHNDNLRELDERFNNSLVKASRARKYSGLHLDNAERLRDAMHAYNVAFGTDYPLPTMGADLDEIREQVAAATLAEKQRRDAAEKQKEIDNAETIAAWLRGDSVRLPALRRVYLRVVGDTVETSHGARFPVSDAINALRFILRCTRDGIDYKRSRDTDAPRYSLGYYKIDSISKTGTVRAGCHTVALAQIKTAAAMLPRGAV